MITKLTMKKLSVLIVLQIFVIGAISKKSRLAPYVKPCSKSAPDFEQCCLEHGKDALPFIFKGDKKVGIPNMLPLVIPEVKINAGNNLKILLKDVHVHGLDKSDLKQVKIDLDNFKITIKVDISELELIGKYEMDGKVMILPITGKGDMKITAIGGQYVYQLNYGIEKKNGIEFVQLTDKDNLDFDLKNAKLHFDNLFNGDKKLGDQMNTFLNENWKEVLKEFGLPISETIRAVGRSIASSYFKKIPYHELILD